MVNALALESDGYTLLGTGKTVADWHAFDETKRNLELIDGELWLAPYPNSIHHFVLSSLVMTIGPWVNQESLGRMYLPPTGVLTPSGNMFEPDALFIPSGHPQANENWLYLTHPPTLIIEIVSGCTRPRDWITKFKDYAAMGVPNYWIVEPSDETIWGFKLMKGAYEEVVQTVPNHFEAPPFPGLRIPLAKVFTVKSNG